MEKNKHSVETIVAIATAPGRGGVGIVRLSGPRALEVGLVIFSFASKKISKDTLRPSKLYRGIVRDTSSGIVDDGLFVWMPQGKSFTGEDIVELQLHGSPLGLSRVVELCVSRGTRLAEPGEFTKRAFLNGKMDLIQAEAVAELIHAESVSAYHVARKRLDGSVSTQINELYKDMTEILAECEADIDFPDENLPLQDRQMLMDALERVRGKAKFLITSYQRSRSLMAGYSIAILGKPNAGKSSLFNAILQQDRAIVSASPGTTRDFLNEELVLQGRKVRFVDTAGLREDSIDPVEMIGIQKSLEVARAADLILYVVDVTKKDFTEDQEFLENLKHSEVWILWNKMDQLFTKQPSLPNFRQYYISVKKDGNVNNLIAEISALLDVVYANVSQGEGLGTDRQYQMIVEFRNFFEQGIEVWSKNFSVELASFELRQAHRCLARLLGRSESHEDILTEVFKRFCIGK